MADIPGDSDANEVSAADGAIGWVECNPARARKIDLRPGMCGSCATGSDDRDLRIVEIARRNAGAESQTAHGFDKEHGKIAARAPTASERFQWALCALIIAALVRYPRSNSLVQIFQQGKRVGSIGRDERVRPFP